jgi:hypothetical protein
MLTFTCPRCNTTLQIPEQHAGATCVCSACKGSLTVPIIAAVAQPAAVPTIHATACRCYDCGQVIPEEELQRRTVTTGTGAGFAGNPLEPGNWMAGGIFQRVDLCLKCARKRDKRRKELANSLSSALYWVALLAFIGLVGGLLCILIWSLVRTR